MAPACAVRSKYTFCETAYFPGFHRSCFVSVFTAARRARGIGLVARPQSAVKHHTVHHGRHGVLADSEVDVVPREGILSVPGARPDDPAALDDRGRGGAREIRRASDGVGRDLDQALESVAAEELLRFE